MLQTVDERNTFQRAARRHTRSKSVLPPPQVTRRFATAIDGALAALYPHGDIDKVRLYLFSNRASRRAIYAWRSGEYATPQWALDLVKQHLEARRDRVLQALSDLERLTSK